MIGIALSILRDVPKPDQYEWFEMQRVVRLTVEDQDFWGVTTKISEGGVELTLTQITGLNRVEELPVQLKIMEEGLELPGQITDISYTDEVIKVRVVFEPLSLPQYRRLVELLFCRPGQWKQRETPGELRSVLLLFKTLLKPRLLFARK
jgi:cellulose synthase (UDP-forming)